MSIIIWGYNNFLMGTFVTAGTDYIKKHQYLGVFGLSLILSFLVYGNTLVGEFLYDDSFFMFRPELRDLNYIWKIWFESALPQNPLAGTYRPLAILTFLLNYVLFGESPLSFRIVNVALHGSVGFLVFVLVQTLYKNWRLSAVTSLIFIVLPIHSEVVAQIKSRDEILAGLFGLAAWILFLKSSEVKKIVKNWYLWIGLLMLFLSLLSKETAIIMPGIILVHSLMTKQKIRRVIFYASGILFILFGYFSLRYMMLGEFAFGQEKGFWVINPLSTEGFFVKLWTAFKLLYMYIEKTLVPVNLSATYFYNHLSVVYNPITSGHAISGIILFGLLVVIILNKKEAPLGVGGVFFLAAFLSLSKVFFSAGDIFAERFFYLGSFGLSLMLGYLLVSLFRRQKYLASAVLAVLFLTYSVSLVFRNTVWLKPESLYQSMIQDAPNSVQGYTSLARLYFSKGEYSKAKPFIEKGMAIYDSHPPLLQAYSYLKMQEGDFESAEKSIIKSILIFPDPESLLIQATIFSKKGEYKESIDFIGQNLRSQVKSPDVRFLMAVNLYKSGRVEDAKIFFDWNNTLSEEAKIQQIQQF